MKCERTPKAFYCVKWMREVRERIYEETAGMSGEEWRWWREARIRTDPVLVELYDRRKAPAGGRVPAEAVGGLGAALHT